MPGQQLTSEGGLFSLTLTTTHGLFAYFNSYPPQPYYSCTLGNDYIISYAQFQTKFFVFFEGNNSLSAIFTSLDRSRYMRVGLDGHSRVYDIYWQRVNDLLTSDIGPCDYPTVCGKYSICITKDQCSCPEPRNGTSYFQHIQERQPDLGCSLVTQLSCEASKYHILLELQNVTYFPFRKQSYPQDINPDHQDINLECCKLACLKFFSCKAAIYNSSSLVGNCYLQSQIFSLRSIVEKEEETYFKVYIKVQNNIPPPGQNNVPPQQQKNQLQIILGSTLASFFSLLLFIGILGFLFWKKENADEAEYSLDLVLGMPTRYSYDDLQAITKQFNTELGHGGFGTVFKGTLFDGATVAVKCLDGFSQIKKSFLVEVETIGSVHHFNLSVHHFNLVRLIEFCAEKYHWLLVYEYMSNGSLDK